MNATNITIRQEAKEAYSKYLRLLKNSGSADRFLENAEYYIENVLPLEMLGRKAVERIEFRLDTG